MGIWLILGAMTALAVGLTLYPLMRGPRASSSRREHNLAVYRAQLDELRQERERGLIGAREAAAAALEIERRMLAADADERETRGPVSPASAKGVALALALGLPLLSLGVYWQLGAPDQPAAPFAGREAMQQQLAGGPGGIEAGVPSVESLIARLETQVEAAPADLEAWLRLGRAYALTERHEAAARAYRQALTLRDDLPTIQAALGESLTKAADGMVTEPARGAFERALALDPGEPRARFYRGVALLQRGQQQDALDAWLALLADSPADAPWADTLRLQIADVARAFGHDPDAVLAAAGERTTRAAEPVAGTPLERQAQALRLEARLEAEPDDWQGWIELARLWGGLGDPDRARRALESGEAHYARAPFVREQFRQAATELGLVAPGPAQPGPSAEQVQAAEAMTPEEQQEMIRGMVEGLAARLEQDPDDLQGWRMLGRSYQVLGEPEKAARAYERLASLLPPGSPESADLRAVIEQLRARE